MSLSLLLQRPRSICDLVRPDDFCHDTYKQPTYQKILVLYRTHSDLFVHRNYMRRLLGLGWGLVGSILVWD
jgi:hypothetical protein